MTAFYLGPLGRLRPVPLVQRGASAQVSRASSTFETLGGRRYVQRAPRGPRDWGLSLGERRDPSVVAHLAACASGALPGPLFLYAGDAARTNLLPAEVAAPCQAGSSALGSVAGTVAVGMPSGVESLTGVVQQATVGAWSATIPVRSQVAYVLSAWGSAAGALIEWRTVSAGGVPVASGTLSAAAVEGGFYGAVEMPSGTAAGVQVRLAAGSRTVGGLRLVEGVLPSSGAVTRRNLVPNPSFEVGVAGVVSGTGITTTRSLSPRPGVVGDYVMLISAGEAVAANQGYAYQAATVSGVDGQWVAFSARVARSTGASYVRLVVAFYGAGGYITQSTGAMEALSGTQAALVSIAVTGQAPVGTIQVRAFLYVYGNATATQGPPAGITITDAWMLTTAATEAAALAQAADYFDGSTTPEPHRYVAWDGTPHASTSTERILPDDATWPGWAPGRGVPQVVVDDPTETLQLVTTSEILADYTVTIREVG